MFGFLRKARARGPTEGPGGYHHPGRQGGALWVQGEIPVPGGLGKGEGGLQSSWGDQEVATVWGWEEYRPVGGMALWGLGGAAGPGDPGGVEAAVLPRPQLSSWKILRVSGEYHPPGNLRRPGDAVFLGVVLAGGLPFSLGFGGLPSSPWGPGGPGVPGGCRSWGSMGGPEGGRPGKSLFVPQQQSAEVQTPSKLYLNCV